MAANLHDIKPPPPNLVNQPQPQPPMKVEPVPETNNGSSSCTFMIKIVELERQLREEKESSALFRSESELKMMSACQEVDKYKRACSCLEEHVARLEQDCKTLMERCSLHKDRELRDQERIKRLMADVERKDMEFKQKLVELTVENRDLECGKRRAVDEVSMLKKKYDEVHARELRFVEEIFSLKNGKGKKGSTSCGEISERSKKDGFVVIDSDGEGEEGDGDEADKEEGDPPATQHVKKKVRLTTSVDGVVNAEPLVPAKGTNEVGYTELLSCSKRNLKQRPLIGQPCAQKRAEVLLSREPPTRRPDAQLSAEKRAEILQNNLKSGHASFIKSMVDSRVQKCLFWLGLPYEFCKENLSVAKKSKLKMILEDEKGLEYSAVYVGGRNGLSGGWRNFALDHSLELGDALIFELYEPTRFKVYIIKANQEPSDGISDEYCDDWSSEDYNVAKSSEEDSDNENSEEI